MVRVAGGCSPQAVWGAAVIIVIDPYPQGGAAGAFTVVSTGVEDVIDQQPFSGSDVHRSQSPSCPLMSDPCTNYVTPPIRVHPIGGVNAVAEPDTAVNFGEYPSPASYKTPPETVDSAPALSSTRCGNGEEAERSMDWELFTNPTTPAPGTGSPATVTITLPVPTSTEAGVDRIDYLPNRIEKRPGHPDPMFTSGLIFSRDGGLAVELGPSAHLNDGEFAADGHRARFVQLGHGLETQSRLT